MRSKDLIFLLNVAHVAVIVVIETSFQFLVIFNPGPSESREHLKGKTMKWYVLQFTTTRFEAVFTHLKRINISYFCPMKTEKYRRPDKIISYRERRTPLFPGYLFIQVDFQGVDSTTVTSLPYVQRIISFGSEPLPVPEDVMADLLDSSSSSSAQINLMEKSTHYALAEIFLMENEQQRSMALIHLITDRSLINVKERIKQERNENNTLKKSEPQRRSLFLPTNIVNKVE